MVLGDKTIHFVLAGFLVEKMSLEICRISSEIVRRTQPISAQHLMGFLEVLLIDRKPNRDSYRD